MHYLVSFVEQQERQLFGVDSGRKVTVEVVDVDEVYLAVDFLDPLLHLVHEVRQLMVSLDDVENEEVLFTFL